MIDKGRAFSPSLVEYCKSEEGFRRMLSFAILLRNEGFFAQLSRFTDST
jgi:hypothetical protein